MDGDTCCGSEDAVEEMDKDQENVDVGGRDNDARVVGGGENSGSLVRHEKREDNHGPGK